MDHDIHTDGIAHSTRSKLLFDMRAATRIAVVEVDDIGQVRGFYTSDQVFALGDIHAKGFFTVHGQAEINGAEKISAMRCTTHRYWYRR